MEQAQPKYGWGVNQPQRQQGGGFGGGFMDLLTRFFGSMGGMQMGLNPQEQAQQQRVTDLRGTILDQLGGQPAGGQPTQSAWKGVDPKTGLSIYTQEPITGGATTGAGAGGDTTDYATYRQELQRQMMGELEPRFAASMQQRGLTGSSAYGTGLASLTSQTGEKAWGMGEEMRRGREAQASNLEQQRLAREQQGLQTLGYLGGEQKAERGYPQQQMGGLLGLLTGLGSLMESLYGQKKGGGGSRSWLDEMSEYREKAKWSGWKPKPAAGGGGGGAGGGFGQFGGGLAG